MFRLEWTERGLKEFNAALAFIAAENPFNAQLVHDRTMNTLKKLEYFTLGLSAPNNTHKIYVPNTSYFVIFRRDERGNVKICAFFHAARDWERIDWENL